MNRETKKLLWKLRFLPGKEIPEDDLDPKNLPEDVFKKEKLNRTAYYKVDDSGVTPEEVELFLKVKNARCVDTVRKFVLAVLVCMVCSAVLVIPLLWRILTILGV